jgi:hypothetical protein
VRAPVDGGLEIDIHDVLPRASRLRRRLMPYATLLMRPAPFSGGLSDED